MTNSVHYQDFSIEQLRKEVQEREKKLTCLYNIEQLLNTATDVEDALQRILVILPTGWQYPEFCQVKILYQQQEFCSPHFCPNEWSLHADIRVDAVTQGEIEIAYTHDMPFPFEGQFLKEEQQLLNIIADRLGTFLAHQKSRTLLLELEETKKTSPWKHAGEWARIVDLLRKTDHELFLFVSRKMIYYLCWSGIKEAQELLQNFGTNQKLVHSESARDENRPLPKISFDMLNIASKIFEIAASYLSDEEIMLSIQRWMKENRTNFLRRCLESRDTSLSDIFDALRQFHYLMLNEQDLPFAIQELVNAELVSRILSEQLEFVQVAKSYITIKDMYDLLKHTIYPTQSHGKIGGKSAGMFLAFRILNAKSQDYPELKDVKIPKTWYVTSDTVHNFIYFNNLEEIFGQKYKQIGQVRLEYPHIIQVFKNAVFPPEILNGLSMALDDFGERPLVVRSSSLLEDRGGAVFSGKYKSLFVANQGTKVERMEALTDALAEVFASLFGPDPIEYRAEHGLLDFHEEMGALIQEVIGVRVGKYFFPAYAGVSFSTNEFRWSPRIQHKDGLIRLVPGLGTRAVDRVADDYPVLIAPGQPNLRVNVTLEEHIRYSPRYLDVINLETNSFETVKFDDLLQEYGDDIPFISQLVSIVQGDILVQPGFMTDLTKEMSLITFEGLRKNTRVIEQIHTMNRVLQDTLHSPVDLEFVSDGQDLYLVQCRPQTSFLQNEAPQIPKDVPHERVLFSANEYISNGNITNITYLVYVDPEAYNNLESHEQLLDVGRAIGKLNKRLPKRQFILMGPGRWGSRGDIKLGVRVTYSDINNTAALIEVARKQGNYVPELSFGTHFFQDLVEASIRYLPLYPDNDDVIFNEIFFTDSPNIFPHLLPEYASLNDTIKVIDIQETTGGFVLSLVMNAEQDKALAYLVGVRQDTQGAATTQAEGMVDSYSAAEHWRWRLRMATRLGRATDPERFGIAGLYLIGSTQHRNAAADSDLDLLIHVSGTQEQRQALNIWLDAWSICLDEMNYLNTGYKIGGLLHPHLVTDDDIANGRGVAVKIGAATDPARKLPLMKKL
ncbi:phosphoenolpyruvate synthase [Candidatus Vecturithrix granuli]|uniref:Phosphoenolpyruvate synthase n=1 Tax=Vecturithrix granuli TaxID=1499967 RepID=A0A081BZT4_VECG1|nr:phosphoenolpyruvate synthase [Candidatus Vecturithrix granuli]